MEIDHNVFVFQIWFIALHMGRKDCTVHRQPIHILKNCILGLFLELINQSACHRHIYLLLEYRLLMMIISQYFKDDEVDESPDDKDDKESDEHGQTLPCQSPCDEYDDGERDE